MDVKMIYQGLGDEDAIDKSFVESRDGLKGRSDTGDISSGGREAIRRERWKMRIQGMGRQTKEGMIQCNPLDHPGK